MFYGQYDWMDMSGGLSAQKSCQEFHNAPTVQVYMVRNAVRVVVPHKDEPPFNTLTVDSLHYV
jgi:hypothetical protein